MTITATQLRKDIYRVISRVAASGVPVRVTCRGRTVRLVPDGPPSKLKNLKKRPVIKCPPDQLVHIDWSSAWQPFI